MYGKDLPPLGRGSDVVVSAVGEDLVDVDELKIEVGRVFMDEYGRQSVPVKLERGKLTEVTIHLKRP